ncbi:hypothetical protein DSO57_1033644 [Entomophthora muscae]|uniref:Uncharacterized protein n=1 Tax=Entomophthora muscae TaxID=34485 RepID=A0ACC2REV5_9FUNG|nr:hypothetical protein DSO57_1033644 [Entomophthora muscae]
MLETCHRVKENVGDMQQMMGQWLLEKPKGETYQEHFSEWISWLMFDREEESLTSEEQVQLQRVLTEFCQGLKKSPKPLLHKPKCMRPSLDIFPIQPKPLVAYLGIKCINALTYLTLRHLGFHRYSEDGLSYWHCSGNSSEPPIIFIHGLGIGLFPYLEKIRRLRNHSDKSIFLLELPHISMEIYHNILNHDQTLAAIDSLFKRHSLYKVSLVAHSYGTLIASWLIQHRQHLLHKVTLLDPICFNMWESTLVTNFLYAKPFAFSHEMAQFFVAQDPLISHTLTKEIYWYESVLFPQDIHVPTNIFLSSQDWVVDAAACADYLHSSLPPSGKVHLLETSHGGYLTNPSEYDRVFNTL